MAYTKYSLTPANNTAAPPDGAPEGMLPSAVNDTMRDMMAQIRDCGDGIRDGTYTMTAPKITGGTITGSTINNSAIGGTTAAAGAFTTLSATGVTTVQAGTVSLPAITTTGDTNTGIYFPAADTIAFTEGGVESMRIDSSGNVGIGTSSPSQKLDVAGDTRVSNSSGNKRFYIGQATPSANDGGSLEFQNSNTQINWAIRTNFNVAGALEFCPSSAAGGVSYTTPSMIVNSSGNLGLGTSSPSSRLSVTGSANIATFDGGSATSITLTGSSRSDIFLIDSGAATDQKRLTIRGDGGNFIFGVENDAVTAFTERMRIDSSGNVGIGTSSPSQKLSVIGDAYVDTQIGVATAPVSASGIKITAGLNSGDGGNPRSCILCNTNQSPGSNPFILFTNLSNNTAGSITHTGTTTVAYNTSSDYRLKENIAPMTGALAKVAQLKPCTYTWKEDGTDGQGFIAHELQEVISDCVSGEKDAVNADGSIKPQGVDTSFLVATLTAAIQELKAEFDAYKATHP